MRMQVAEPWFDGLPPIMEFCCADATDAVNAHLARPFRYAGGVAATDGKIVACIPTTDNSRWDEQPISSYMIGLLDEMQGMVFETLTFPAFGTVPEMEPCLDCGGPKLLPPIPVEVAPNAFFAHAYLQRLRQKDIRSVGLSIVERKVLGTSAATIRFEFEGGFGFLTGVDMRHGQKLPAWRLGSAAMFFHPDRA